MAAQVKVVPRTVLVVTAALLVCHCVCGGDGLVFKLTLVALCLEGLWWASFPPLFQAQHSTAAPTTAFEAPTDDSVSAAHS